MHVTAVNTAVNENNAVIDADNGQIAANNEKITSAKTKAISSSQTIQQAVDSLTAKRNEIASKMILSQRLLQILIMRYRR